MNTAERLQRYYSFDDDIVESVAGAAHDQNQHDFTSLADKYNVAENTQVVYGGDSSRALQLLTLKPEQDYDANHARVLYTPMAIPIDSSIAMRSIRLFASDPSQQLIVVGNPGALGKTYGKLSMYDAWLVSKGDLSPTVDPLLDYLATKHIASTDQIGYSYGADKAATASERAVSRGISVSHGVWMESAAVVKRTVGSLALDFAGAGEYLEESVDAADSRPLREARDDADTGWTRYILGLGRLSNLAIARALAGGNFKDRASRALNLQSGLKAGIVWGTESELSCADAMQATVDSLQRRFGTWRVGGLAMTGMRHANGDDIDLHAAMVLQGLRV